MDLTRQGPLGWDQLLGADRGYQSRTLSMSGSPSLPPLTTSGQGNFTIVTSPIEAAKAIKNDVELDGFRCAYVRDGVAWAKWAAWLEHAVKFERRAISEWDAAQALTEIRSRDPNFVSVGTTLSRAPPLQ
jgi:Xaa-Pro aminopeptidase